MPNEPETRRVHVFLPGALLDEIDALVGDRQRSQFFVDAVTAHLARHKLRHALSEMGGTLADAIIPEWRSPEAAAA